jgi:tRNA(Ile)-lysidine synthase TilS/MesJ
MPRNSTDCVRTSFEAFFLRHPTNRKDKIVVALSGGSDSVALLL